MDEEQRAERRAARSRARIRQVLWAAVLGAVSALTPAFVFLSVTGGKAGDGRLPAAADETVRTVKSAEPGQGETASSAQDNGASPAVRTARTASGGEDGLVALQAPADIGSLVSTGKGAVADVAATCMPSVVAITTVSIKEIPSFFGYGQQYKSAASGSGIIVGENDTELLIATNNHVISGASTVSVLFTGDDESISPEGSKNGYTGYSDGLNLEGAVNALVKGTDEENDLAVIAVKKEEISEETKDRIRIATLGDSDSLVVGEQVVAIGNALGYGQSVTSGWISALNRTFSTASLVASSLIQTDAAINPGNSGGALLNMQGEVIGINSAKYSNQNVEGMGYAIPISRAYPILEDLMNRTTREELDPSEAAYLGVSVADLSWEATRMYNIPTGAFVAEAFPGEAAYNAGIREGDIITQIDGEPVDDRDDLITRLQYYRAGEEVEIVFARKMDGFYVEQSVFAVMGVRPSQG